jgi:hypothetical protein
MRGLLVDREAQEAAATQDRLLPAGVVYDGNFLTWSVLEGRVSSVRWIHSRCGGRKRDIETVKYLTDLTALPVRLGLRRVRWRPFRYEVTPYEQWQGTLRPGEHLDVDWDFFASIRGPRAHIAERARRFVELPFGSTPAAIYLAYSEPYSHPSETLFEEFAEALARRFGASIERLPDPRWVREGQRPPLVKRSIWVGKRALRRLGLY